MSISSRINYKNAKLKRKLYSNKIRLKGLDVSAIHITVDEDRYGDKEPTIENHSKIEMVIDFPSKEIRMGNVSRSNNEFYQQFQSVYDVIPIEAYTRMDKEYQLENDDIIIYKYLLEPYQTTEEPKFFLQALQVVDSFGRFSNTLLYRKYILAPYTFSTVVEPKIQALIKEIELEPIIF
jgi:hypothetical protein